MAWGSSTRRCEWAKKAVLNTFPDYDAIKKETTCLVMFGAKNSSPAKYCGRGCYLADKRGQYDKPVPVSIYGTEIKQ